MRVLGVTKETSNSVRPSVSRRKGVEERWTNETDLGPGDLVGGNVNEGLVGGGRGLGGRNFDHGSVIRDTADRTDQETSGIRGGRTRMR